MLTDIVTAQENEKQKFCNVTVGIPTYQRVDKLVTTIEQILACNPRPNEIIIHIDAGDRETESIIKANFPEILIIESNTKVGPGGGRNKIIERASNSIVASFDDDSYPIDPDYFKHLQNTFSQYPQIAVVAAQIFHPGESVKEITDEDYWVVGFTGCGCAYRREAFLETSGYVPLPIAYGMEEVDLSLRLYCNGWRILDDRSLRVFHNTRLDHHVQPEITAGSVANLALLAYLRYPISYWPYGLLQCCNRILWLIKNRRVNGIGQGVLKIPPLIIKHRHSRKPLPAQCLTQYLAVRQESVPAVLDMG